jgi:thymidylate synthase ThyX
MNNITATVICDSINSNNERITTLICTYPRIIHAEILTHRSLSRNAASSRAIPHAKMIENLKANPFIPERWMKAHKGMQGTEYFNSNSQMDTVLRNSWSYAIEGAILYSNNLSEHGLTKQLTNRLLEPFQMYTSLITATEWENFLYLRTSQHAEIHLQELADKILIALNNSDPVSLLRGEWHLPFSDKMEGLTNEQKIKLSTARCARVSYLTHDGEHSIEKDIAMHDKLTKDGHWSPTEHQAYSEPGCTSGNFKGWKQYRKSFNNEKASFSGLVKKVFNGNNMY